MRCNALIFKKYGKYPGNRLLTNAKTYAIIFISNGITVKINRGVLKMRKSKFIRMLTCFVSAITLFAVAVGVSACDNKPNTPDTPDTPTKVTLEVEETSATIGIGKTFAIKATAKNTKEKIMYKSDPEAIATVDENGVVTGVATGEATITVTVEEEKVEVKITVADYTVDTKNRTINIYCKEGLLAFAEKINAREIAAKNYTVNLLSDVDLGGSEWTPLYGYAMTNSTINGNNHTINNFKIMTESSCATTDGASVRCMGFVGGSYGITFKNITFSDVEMQNAGDAYCAVAVGYLEGTGTFENVTVKDCKIQAPYSRRGAAALVGYAHDKTGDNGVAYLVVRNCTVENLEIESPRVTGLVARVQENAVINSEPTGIAWKAEIMNNKVNNCTFRCNRQFTSNEAATMHWATTRPDSSIGAEADEGNEFSGNKYFFDGIEYEYSAGVFTVKSI